MIKNPCANNSEKQRAGAWARLGVPVAVLSALGLYVLAMPGTNFSAFAWFFLLPLVLLAALRPRWKTWLKASGFFCYFSGVLVLIWLRHLYPPLGWSAVFLLPLAYSAFPFIWLVALRFLFPACSGDKPFWFRATNLLGLAGFWVVLEWAQTWVLTGFPWMPLSGTQWDFPAMLALCRFAGPNITSFIIVFFNLALTRYLRQQFVEVRRDLIKNEATGTFPSLRFLRSICPEFYLALVPVFLSIVFFVYTCIEYEDVAKKYFSFAAVQTDFDPTAKWDAAHYEASMEAIVCLTKEAPALGAEVVLWPEAALPFYVEKNGENGYDKFLEKLAREIKIPILFGGIAPVPNTKNGYFNSVHIVDPRFGLVEAFAAKRHLVPFGEYVPLADIFPLRKVVPIEHDCVPAAHAEPLRLRIDGRVVRVGVLVCYEDVFPELGRDLVRAGAEVLAVVTNDAWYGREAGAYQHMAHSVLQAVSLGVPVVRCGNAGWSGVISPIGQIKKMENSAGTIYFRGVQAFDVYGYKNPQKTFYARHGNWLILLGAILFAGTLLLRFFAGEPLGRRE